MSQAILKLSGNFFDITGERLSITSQLNGMDILQDVDKTKFMNIFKFYTINDLVKNNSMMYYVYEVEHNEWLEYIANKVYKNVNLWWIIALMNDFVNPFEELDLGILLKILKPEYISQILRELTEFSKLGVV